VRRGSVGRSRTVAQQTLRTAPRLRPSSRPLPEGFRRWPRRIISSWQDWTGADLGELAKGQLAPFCLEGQERLSIEGPKVTLSPPQAIALGVVLHELGTNAARYGALSNGIGRSTFRGRSDQAGWFLPGPSAKVRRSYPLSARGSAPSSFNAAFLTRPSIGASRPRAWSAQSIFRSPSCSPRTAAPLALTYKLT
jgi:hypothetical protein